MRWPAPKISEITNVISGGTPKSGVAEYWEGDVEWITPKDMGKMSGIYVSDTSRKISKLGLQKSSAKLISENSVILSTRAPIGHLAINTVPMATNQGCRGLEPKDNLETKYLYYFLLNSVELLNKLGSGTTFKELSKGALGKVCVPLPAVLEQKRIVAILDKAFAEIEQARANTEQNLKNARELFESYLQQVFSQRGEGWVDKNLNDLCHFENGDRGKNYPSRSKFVDSGIAFINAGHIDDGNIDLSKMNYISEDTYELLGRGKVQAGDVLFCLRGSLGKFAVVQASMRGAIASSLVIIRPHSDLSVQFLLHYLRSGLCKVMIDKYAAGAAQPNLGAKDLAKFAISVPPKDQQKDTSDILNTLMAEIESLERVYHRKLGSIDELKKSILQKAFTGELTKEESKGVAA